MATKTLLSVEDYLALEEPPCERYELSHGELIVTPSSSPRHNTIRDELHFRLRTYSMAKGLGLFYSETDVRLAADVVRRPDLCFFRAGRLEGVDLDRAPLPVAPDLAIEIVSRTDRADDLLLKVTQYLDAGAQAAWLLYPATRLAYRYVHGKLGPEVFSADAGHCFEEPDVLVGFTLPLNEIFSK